MKSLSAEWANIVATYPHPIIEFGGALVVQVLFFWVPCALYLSLDHIAPAFSQRHKIQPNAKPPTRAEMAACLRVVLRNQLVSMIVHILLLSTNYFSGRPSNYDFTPTIPSVFQVLFDGARSLLVREIAFYYAHRAFHHPALYARVHKLHHRFVAPFSLAAQYASVPEHIIANVLPIALPGLLFRSHILSYWAFVASQLIDTSTVHSGYDFFARFAAMHDSHHELFTVNYGVFGLWDWLHGTNKPPQLKKSAKKAE